MMIVATFAACAASFKPHLYSANARRAFVSSTSKMTRFKIIGNEACIARHPLPAGPSMATTALSRIKTLVCRVFVPLSEVHSFYGRYSWWTSISGCLGAFLTSLSTRAMFQAVSGEADPAGTASCAASVSRWLVRDALGQLGGLVGISAMGRMPDLNPKASRVLGNTLHNGMTCIEICSPLLLLHLQSNSTHWWTGFVALAAIFGTGKTLAMTLLSASRAHQLTWLARRRAAVIGELTTRAATQMTGAGLVGTLAGIVVGQLCLTSWTSPLLAAVLAVGSWYAMRQSCRYALTAVLSRHQLPLLIDALKGNAVPTPEEFSLTEPIAILERKLAYLEPFEATLQIAVSVADLEQAKSRGYLSKTIDGVECMWLVKGSSTRAHLAGMLRFEGIREAVLTELEKRGWDLDGSDLTSDRSIFIEQ